jgi:hypothetical protein
MKCGAQRACRASISRSRAHRSRARTASLCRAHFVSFERPDEVSHERIASAHSIGCVCVGSRGPGSFDPNREAVERLLARVGLDEHDDRSLVLLEVGGDVPGDLPLRGDGHPTRAVGQRIGDAALPRCRCELILVGLPPEGRPGRQRGDEQVIDARFLVPLLTSASTNKRSRRWGPQALW